MQQMMMRLKDFDQAAMDGSDAIEVPWHPIYSDLFSYNLDNFAGAKDLTVHYFPENGRPPMSLWSCG